MVHPSLYLQSTLGACLLSGGGFSGGRGGTLGIGWWRATFFSKMALVEPAAGQLSPLVAVSSCTMDTRVTETRVGAGIG